MTYDLHIGDRTFSSWSLRGWLLLERFGLPVRVHEAGLYAGTLRADLADLAPARTVPVLRTPEGHVLTDSIAIAETLAERHPNAGFWPEDAGARALARSLVAEMHAGFGALRADCPMMLAHRWAGFVPTDAVRADLDRICKLWSLARDRHGGDDPWLFDRYSVTDAYFAPVALRIATYDLPVTAAGRAYVGAHLRDPAIAAWRDRGLRDAYDPMPYRMGLPERPWPEADEYS